jgi:2-hydroxychromene-2-carboxylate isomerase
MSRPIVDFWFEFASTYSYPAAMRIAALAETADVSLRWRPFLLGPIFIGQGWTNSPFNLYPLKGRYMWRDVERTCSDLGLAFSKPDPFPQTSLQAARVTLVGLAEGWGEQFARSIFQAEFAEGRPISDISVIADVLKRLGLKADPILARAGSDEIKAKLRAETELAQRIGVFGAPTFVCEDGELFWGNDRLEQALAWAAGRKASEASVS